MSNDNDERVREKHTFQLYWGMGPSASAVGMPQEMTGATAIRLNQRFVQHHTAMTDKDTRLWNWKQIDATGSSHRISPNNKRMLRVTAISPPRKGD